VCSFHDFFHLFFSFPFPSSFSPFPFPLPSPAGALPVHCPACGVPRDAASIIGKLMPRPFSFFFFFLFFPLGPGPSAADQQTPQRARRPFKALAEVRGRSSRRAAHQGGFFFSPFPFLSPPSPPPHLERFHKNGEETDYSHFGVRNFREGKPDPPPSSFLPFPHINAVPHKK